MAGRQIPWLVSLCLLMCIYFSRGGKSVAISTEIKAVDDRTMYFATQTVTVRVIGDGVKSSH